MEENRNNRSVEKRLKDHLKNDRARIQVGRISHFGLMEMSRQRIRASVLESTMKPCPHCGGTGHVRSDSSVALMVVRAIEEFLLKDSRSHITVRTPAATALYVLNHKRANLVELETRFGLTITLEADETLGAQHYAIFRGAVAEKPEGFVEVRSLPSYVEPEEPEEEIVVEEEEEISAQAEQPRHPQQGQHQQRSEDGEGRKRRKRRRRRGGKDRDREHQAHGDAVSAHAPADAAETSGEATAEVTAEAPAGSEADEEDHGKKRRRGKRGGKRNRREEGETAPDAASEAAGGIEGKEAEVEAPEGAPPVAAAEGQAAPSPANDDVLDTEKPKKPRRASRSKKAAEEKVAETAPVPAAELPAEPVAAEPELAASAPAEAEASANAHPTRRKPPSIDAPVVPVVSSNVTEEAKAEEKPKRAGWWQRKGFF